MHSRLISSQLTGALSRGSLLRTLPKLSQSANLFTTNSSATTTSANKTAANPSSEFDYQYIERSPEPTNQNQASLPLLPIPKLEDTCVRYLNAIRPLVANPTQLADTEKHVDEFARSCGKQLDHELRKRAAEITDRPYYYDDWMHSYLVHRDELPIHLNPYMGLKADPDAKYQQPVFRAANLLISLLRFRRSLVDNVLSPLNVEIRPFHAMYATTRLPGAECDELAHYSNSRHVVFLRNGVFYRFDVLDSQGAIRPANEISSFIAGLYEHAKNEEDHVPITAFTADKRTNWASARAQLTNLSEQNAQNLNLIDSALMVICLDNEEYDHANESSFTLGLLHGTYQPEVVFTDTEDSTLRKLNRWFDKSIQLIISKHGDAGINFEHSWGDGAVVLNVLDRIYKDTIENRFVTEDPKPISQDAVKASKLNFTLNDGLRNEADRALQAYRKLASRIQMNVAEYSGMNRDFLKKKHISPDFIFQLAFQMANYKIFTNTSTTYEACSTAAFKLGRTENLRSATMETKKACKALAWGESKYSFPDLRSMIVEASNRHQQLSKLAAKGEGCDRHLFALRCLARQLEMTTPSIYTDPTYSLANKFILSTSHLYGQNVRAGGYGPVEPDGFGLAYGFTEKGMTLNCTTFEQQDAEEFAAAFISSLQDINNVLERS